MFPKTFVNHPHGISEIFVDDNTHRIYCSICNAWVIVKEKRPQPDEFRINELKNKILPAAVKKFGRKIAENKFKLNPLWSEQKRWLYNMVCHYQETHQEKKKTHDLHQKAIRQVIRYNVRSIKENGFVIDDLSVFEKVDFVTKLLMEKTLKK